MTPEGKPAGRTLSGAGTLQAQILEQLTELKGKVEESLQQGRENGNELKMLRRELGLDGQHGRLPIVEATLIRHEARMERHEMRIADLETGNSEAKGKAKLVATALALAGGSAGGALIALLAHLMGAG
jgi:hypothetical protein